MFVVGQLQCQQCTGVFSTLHYSYQSHMPVLVARLVNNGMHYKKDDAASTSLPWSPVLHLHLFVVNLFLSCWCFRTGGLLGDGRNFGGFGAWAAWCVGSVGAG